MININKYKAQQILHTLKLLLIGPICEVGVGLSRLADSFQQSLTLSSPHQIRSLQFLVEAVEFSLVFFIFEKLLLGSGSVGHVGAVTGGDCQLLLVASGGLALVPVLGDGQGEVGQVLDEVLHALVVCWVLLLS